MKKENCMTAAARRFIDSLTGFQRLHNSNEVDLTIKKIDPPILSLGMFDKPWGFWYDINGDWIRWVLSEEMGWLRPYFYEVILDESKAHKQITDLKLFVEFEKQYSRKTNLMETYGIQDDKVIASLERIGWNERGIQWKQVCEEFSSCEIHPYFWEKRLKSKWYYGWDCASGCVWDNSAFKIKKFAYYDKDKDEFVRV